MDGRGWQIETSNGSLEARVLVAAPGLLSEPAIPDLPGLDEFEGPTFHTANWNHEHDLTGRDVAVVGTGATAIQVVPRLQEHVRKLTVFQRTPAWVIPSPDREVSALARGSTRASPSLQRVARDLMWASLELLTPGLTR